jgi:hypothetical protein
MCLCLTDVYFVLAVLVPVYIRSLRAGPCYKAVDHVPADVCAFCCQVPDLGCWLAQRTFQEPSQDKMAAWEVKRCVESGHAISPILLADPLQQALQVICTCDMNPHLPAMPD